MKQLSRRAGFAQGIAAVVLIVAMFILGTRDTLPTVHAQDPDTAAAAVQTWDTNGNNVPKNGFLGTTNNRPLVFKTNNTEKMRILPNGNIGIGTSTPANKLSVNGAADFSGNVGIGNGVPAFKLHVVDSGNTGLRVQTNAAGGTLASFGGNGDFQIDAVNVPGGRFVVKEGGGVGIGTPNPSAVLDVRRSNGQVALSASDDGTVRFGQFYAQSSAGHLCFFHISNKALTTCSSAAEYVPSIDGGYGYPATADLVSIAPEVKNPYGDTHGPFTVRKTTTACDSNLLGYIVKPESGADGEKLNDHYLPLAIYGYFPSKVTMENGTIKRGDPITSSSKPGYGMKATGACKVIGYALEDASADGTIQVFANFGENAISEVAALRGQVNALTQENQMLKAQLTGIEARLAALEGSPNAQYSTEQVSAR